MERKDTPKFYVCKYCNNIMNNNMFNHYALEEAYEPLTSSCNCIKPCKTHKQIILGPPTARCPHCKKMNNI